MSPIAKLFTVINVVLAGVFLGWAANALSTASDFKTQLAAEKSAHEKTKADMGTEKSSLIAAKQELEKTRDTIRGERDQATAEIERLKGQVADEERKNNEMRGDVAKIANSIDNLTAQNKQLAEARDKAMQSQRDAEKARDDAVAAQKAAESNKGDLETQLHTAQNTIADLEKGSTGLKKDLDSANTQLASLVAATGVSAGEISSMPQIEGRVLDISMNVEPGLVAINKGSDDGVKRGFTFEVYDGRTYKGQVRVEYVHPNVSSALIVRAVPGQKIRQGDAASTRL